MPELPEVHTTVTALQNKLPGLQITDVWSTLHVNSRRKDTSTLHNRTFARTFRQTVTGSTITAITRRGKNILISLDAAPTILIHMKMTGHLLYGQYTYDAQADMWYGPPGPLHDDPFNQHIRVVFSLANGAHLALSDMRKFAKVTFTDHDTSLAELGPDPLAKTFTYKTFINRLARHPARKIKQTLTDQTCIAGIGNIYADEMLFRAGIDPRSVTKAIPDQKRRLLYHALCHVLTTGISLAGDSTSDYRRPDGTPGAFHETHQAYQKHGTTCQKRNCHGTIERITVGNRGTHLCPNHQTYYESNR